PLRERPADIPNLAAFFLAREAARLGLGTSGISRAALDVLMAYDWPGNIRQLEKEMARAVLFLADGELLESSRLSPALSAPGAAPRRGTTLAETLQSAEAAQIASALEESGGDVVAAARLLGLGRSTLYRRMKELGITAG